VRRETGNEQSVAQKASPFLFEAKSGKPRFTRLFACISEEEDGYMVQVSLSNERKPGNSAWGEEIVDSFETASEWSQRLPANSRSRGNASRSKYECTTINTARDTDAECGTSAGRVFPFRTSHTGRAHSLLYVTAKTSRIAPN
jgi:hypothetical protein